jgi:hypothetical protein
MISDQEIRSAINDILARGLTSIRYNGAMGRARYCGIEADHLHNLPQILFNLREPLVDYYYRIERPIYLREYRKNQAEMGKDYLVENFYAAEWKVIEAYLTQGK